MGIRVAPRPGRGFGRTTDMLLGAIDHHFSTGRPVVVLGYNAAQAADLRQRFVAMVVDSVDVKIRGEKVYWIRHRYNASAPSTLWQSFLAWNSL